MLAKAKIGWLGTGDANLRDDDPIRRFEGFCSADLDQITTFVLPHHGSIHNSDPNRLVSDAETWVANAQPIHRHWKHPDPELVRAIKKRGDCFRRVGATTKSMLVEKMIVFSYPERPVSYFLKAGNYTASRHGGSPGMRRGRRR